MATPPAKLPDLQGRHILICRPEPEASRLAQCFREAGAVPRVLSLIEREPLPETPERRTLILSLDHYTHIITVSPYAARLLLDEVDTWWPQIPTGIRWYAVGAGTAAVLAEQGLSRANLPRAGPARRCWPYPPWPGLTVSGYCWPAAKTAAN
nr:uroporphyrinogen-III synthase [Marinobacter similis]